MGFNIKNTLTIYFFHLRFPWRIVMKINPSSLVELVRGTSGQKKEKEIPLSWSKTAQIASLYINEKRELRDADHSYDLGKNERALANLMPTNAVRNAKLESGRCEKLPTCISM
jgi:hypothetical protein